MVEVTPQKPTLSLPTWSWPLWVSLIIFFLSVSVFLSMKVYLSRLESDVAAINGKIKAEAAKVSVDDENAVMRLSDSLGAFSRITANHSYFSDFFDLISSLTYSRLVFTKIDADKEKGFIQLKGTAQNYTALAKQIVAIRGNKDVKSLEIKGINFSTNGLEFEVMGFADPKIFTKSNQ